MRLANDANCLAVSEAVDGAAAGAQTVFAVIIGTGCGSGVALNGRAHIGGNGTAGEWGTTRCRGWMKMNFAIALKYRATAASRAVLKPLSPVPALRPITGG